MTAAPNDGAPRRAPLPLTLAELRLAALVAEADEDERSPGQTIRQEFRHLLELGYDPRLALALALRAALCDPDSPASVLLIPAA
jgi:hypothetical protein